MQEAGPAVPPCLSLPFSHDYPLTFGTNFDMMCSKGSIEYYEVCFPDE